MKITCDISIEYGDVNEAKTILKSVEVDNLNFADSYIKGKFIETHIENNSIKDLYTAIVDYIGTNTIFHNYSDSSSTFNDFSLINL